MKCVSLYSGADNLGDGIIQAGHEIILCVEWDKDCCETIKLNHPDIEVINDTVANVLESLPRCDVVVGGPPCPEFSRAKTDRTMDLCEVNNFLRAREITKAKHHFMENVQDLYKIHRQRNFLVNCADYGVPQTRDRRIFTDLSLPIETHSKYIMITLTGTSLYQWTSIKQSLGINEGYISPTGFDHKNQHNISVSVNDPIMTITIANNYQITDRPVMSKKYKKYKNNYKIIRTLTNEELAILQGFRLDFKFFGTKTSVRKQIGNALPAAISKAFFNSIK